MSDTFYEPDQISTGDGQAGGNSRAIAGTARGRASVRKTHAQVYVIYLIFVIDLLEIIIKLRYFLIIIYVIGINNLQNIEF